MMGRSRASSLALLGLMACILGAAHGLELTRDENAAVLDAALADPDAGFHSWAVRHDKPYATRLQPVIAAVAPHASPDLFTTTTTIGGVPAGSNALPEHAIVNVLLNRHGILPGVTPPTTLHSGGPGAVQATSADSSTEQHDWLRLTLQEYADRRAVWVDNARFAAQHNADHSAAGYWLGLTSLADLPFTEFSRLLGTRVHPSSTPEGTAAHPQPRSTADHGGSRVVGSPDDYRQPGFMYEHVELSSLPPALDWRNHSAVSHVKNQGMCGSCWSFATTGAIEGVNALYTKKLAVLSEQELVDCDREVDMGCAGGMMDNAYAYIIEHKGLHLDKDWPYLGHEDPQGCGLPDHQQGRMVSIDAFQDVPVNDEAALLKAVAHHPVAVAVEADSRAFQLYMGGVMSDPGCGTNLNHGVLVVGYGGLEGGHFPGAKSDPPVDPARGPYWIVKNSWGPAWGAAGYINIQMGYTDATTGTQGLCGITLASSYPIKRSPNPPAPKPSPPPPSPPPKPKPSPPKPPKPSPPGPADPVACDGTYACPPATTCCCMDSRASSGQEATSSSTAVPLPSWGQRAPGLRPVHERGACSTWGCCPMVNAICCKDHVHCCPAELPVCDVDQGRCLPPSAAGKQGDGFSLPWFRSLDMARSQPLVTHAHRTQPDRATQSRDDGDTARTVAAS